MWSSTVAARVEVDALAVEQVGVDAPPSIRNARKTRPARGAGRSSPAGR